MVGKICFAADIGLIGWDTDFQSAALADDLPLDDSVPMLRGRFFQRCCAR